MIIGLSFSHNSTTCVIDDKTGETVFCCSEERISRLKNDWGIPYLALDYIFKNIVPKEKVSGVAVGERCRSLYGSEEFVEMMYLGNLSFKNRYIKSKAKMVRLMTKELVLRKLSPKQSYQNIVKKRLQDIGLDAPVRFFDHHRSHAASAFYASPYEEALVFTLDGEGDMMSGSIWRGRGLELKNVNTLKEIASIGKFYRSITLLLGFKGDRHEGKVTGLAAYGDSEKYAPYIRKVLQTGLDETGKKVIVSKIAEKHMQGFNLRKVNILKIARKNLALLLKRYNTWSDFVDNMLRQQFRLMYGQLLDKEFGHFDFKNPDDFREMADLAAATQHVFEEVIVNYIKYYLDQSDTKNVALAGGTFANVKLNQRILELLDTENIYIHPGMGDEGLAYGAAMSMYQETPGAKKRVLETVYLGPSYTDEEIEVDLKKYPVEYEKLSDEDLFERVSSALVDENIVGIYRGKMEYGPRALGHRTILVNPIKREINDIVNKRLKRTEFMPFAPVVLDFCYEEFFKGKKLSGARFASKFMTITLDVKEQWIEKIQGVVHVDGTARPQVISKGDDHIYYGIVKAFYDKTGIGCVVNTSFNMHEEPIVNSPHDALRSFVTGAVDLLVMENYLVTRK